MSFDPRTAKPLMNFDPSTAKLVSEISGKQPVYSAPTDTTERGIDSLFASREAERQRKYGEPIKEKQTPQGIKDITALSRAGRFTSPQIQSSNLELNENNRVVEAPRTSPNPVLNAILATAKAPFQEAAQAGKEIGIAFNSPQTSVPVVSPSGETMLVDPNQLGKGAVDVLSSMLHGSMLPFTVPYSGVESALQNAGSLGKEVASGLNRTMNLPFDLVRAGQKGTQKALEAVGIKPAELEKMIGVDPELSNKVSNLATEVVGLYLMKKAHEGANKFNENQVPLPKTTTLGNALAPEQLDQQPALSKSEATQQLGLDVEKPTIAIADPLSRSIVNSIEDNVNRQIKAGKPIDEKIITSKINDVWDRNEQQRLGELYQKTLAYNRKLKMEAQNASEIRSDQGINPSERTQSERGRSQEQGGENLQRNAEEERSAGNEELRKDLVKEETQKSNAVEPSQEQFDNNVNAIKQFTEQGKTPEEISTALNIPVREVNKTIASENIKQRLAEQPPLASEQAGQIEKPVEKLHSEDLRKAQTSKDYTPTEYLSEVPTTKVMELATEKFGGTENLQKAFEKDYAGSLPESERDRAISFETFARQSLAEDALKKREIPQSKPEAPTLKEKQPYEITAKEWDTAREDLRGKNRQENFTKGSGSQEISRIDNLQKLLYGVTDEASRKMEQAAKEEITLTPEEVKKYDERLNTAVTHKDVIEKALSEGKSIPKEVLADYPDLAEKYKVPDIADVKKEKGVGVPSQENKPQTPEGKTEKELYDEGTEQATKSGKIKPIDGEYYHVAPPEYKSGDILSAHDLGISPEEANAKWSDFEGYSDSYDYHNVSLFPRFEEAFKHNKDFYNGTGKILKVKPKEKPFPNEEGYPSVSRIYSDEIIKNDNSQNQSPRTPKEGVQSIAPSEKVSSTQVNIPEKEKKPFIDYADSIPEKELYIEKNGEYSDFGRETEPHVTALYGLKTTNPKDVEKVIKNYGDVELELGKTSLFKNDKYDVLKVDVKSDDLKNINKKLRDNLEYKSDFPDYKPHMTIAYLKSGEGEKYVGDTRFEGKKIKLSELLFSDPDYKKTPIDLAKTTEKPTSPISEAGEKPTEETKFAETKNVPIKNIETDEGRFQNRANAFSEETASSIEKNYKPTSFEPITLWKDPKDGNDYVLAGHSRLEGMKRRGVKEIPAKYFEGTENEAINYARIESNRKATAEDLLADVKAYKRTKEQGYTKSQLLDTFKKESKIKTLDNFSNLDGEGEFLRAINSDAAKSFPYIERNASWVGELRKTFPQLTDAHERELFDYFYRGKEKNSFIRKEDLFNKVEDRVGDITFKPEQNLALDKLESTGSRARRDTRDIQQKIDLLKARNRELTTLFKGAPEAQKGIFQKEILANRRQIQKLESNMGEIINSQIDIFGQLEKEVKSEGINEEVANEIITSRNPAELRKSAEDIESKAESTKEADLTEAVRKSEELTQPKSSAVEATPESLTKGTPKRIISQESYEQANKNPASAGAKEQIPTLLESKQEPIKASEIISQVEKDLDVPIRIGKVTNRNASAFYKQKPEVIRMREANDLNDMSHEIAHHIDKKIFGGFTKGENKKRFAEWNDELKNLDYDQGKKRAYEGFAEYMRHYLTRDDAAEIAPKFNAYFENKFLPENPKIAEAINNAKESITKWREQGSLARVISQIDFDGKKTAASFGERFQNIKLKAQTAMTDRLQPIRYAVNQILKDANVPKLRPSEDPYQVAMSVQKSSSAKAREFIMEKAYNFQLQEVGKSLKEVVEPVSKDVQNALAYAYAKHGKSLHERGINPGISLEDANYVLKNYSKPEYEQFSKDFTGFANNLVDYLVDAGGLPKESATRMREVNPFYIMLKRAFVDSEISAPKGQGFVDLPSPIKKIKGSGREIINPLESMIAQTEQIIAVADKARVARALADLTDKFEGTGKWIEKVPAPMTTKITELENLKKQIENAGGDLSNADMDSMITLFSQGQSYFGKDNIVSIYRNGKREYFQLHPMLFDAMKGLDKVTLPWFLDYTFGKATRLVRLGATGIRAGFSLITNPIRDAQTFALQSEHAGVRPDKVAKAIFEELRGKSEYAREFRRAGGEMSQPLGLDRKMLQNTMEEILSNDVKSKSLNIVKHPIEALREVLSFPESGTRLAEFESVMKKYEPKFEEAKLNGDLVELKKLQEDATIEASNAASEVTVNFKRAGSYSAILNQIIPFFNPAIQGISRMGRTIYEHPVRSGLRATTILTAPTLALWYLNKDEDWYKNLPDWQKYAFWNFKVGDTIVRLPKPFEWGYVFAGIPEGVANSIYQKDPKYYQKAIGAAITNLSPDITPALVKPAMEAYFNWDMFRERPIVSKSQEGLLPEQQFNTYTSEVAKEAGKILGVSPSKIDHLLSGYTGGLASDILNALPKEYKELADIPIAGRLFTRESVVGLGGQNIQDFYDAYQREESLYRTINNAIKNKRMIDLSEEDKSYLAMRDGLRTTAKDLSELRKKENEINQSNFDHDIKKKMITAIEQGGAKLAEETLNDLRKGGGVYNPDPTLLVKYEIKNLNNEIKQREDLDQPTQDLDNELDKKESELDKLMDTKEYLDYEKKKEAEKDEGARRNEILKRVQQQLRIPN